MERTDKTPDGIVVGAGVVGINTEYANVRDGKLFPGTRDFSAAQFRSGLRPATFSNLPDVGTGFRKLRLHACHRTLRWPHGRGLPEVPSPKDHTG
jgi:hypothetical protein